MAVKFQVCFIPDGILEIYVLQRAEIMPVTALFSALSQSLAHGGIQVFVVVK